jgi:glycosyltransferase involved in cell wall biosynthesis
VQHFQSKNKGIAIKYYKQEENLGLEKNALFVLKESQGEYVMYLGDDDYLHSSYISEVIKKIRYTENLTCILPAIKAINPNGSPTGYYRDKNLKKTYHTGGFKNCLFNSWRGHQLSGVVLKRKGLKEEYDNQSVSNIYPFIYFVAACTLRGTTINLIDYPVSVTQVPQVNKDWDYNIDGLIGEINDNYKKLPISFIKRNILQIALLKNQKWRYMKYISERKYIPFYKCQFSIIIDKNTLILTKLVTPFITHFEAIKWIVIKTASKIYRYVK